MDIQPTLRRAASGIPPYRMDRDRFIALVERSAGILQADAERAVEATFAERISAGQARDLAARLAP
jgi:uncharacterized protein (DUF2267 family)